MPFTTQQVNTNTRNEQFKNQSMYLVASKKAFSFQSFAGGVQQTQVVVAPLQHHPHGFSRQVCGLKQDMDREMTCASHIPSTVKNVLHFWGYSQGKEQVCLSASKLPKRTWGETTQTCSVPVPFLHPLICSKCQFLQKVRCIKWPGFAENWKIIYDNGLIFNVWTNRKLKIVSNNKLCTEWEKFTEWEKSELDWTQIAGIIFSNKYQEITPTTKLFYTEMSKRNLFQCSGSSNVPWFKNM